MLFAFQNFHGNADCHQRTRIDKPGFQHTVRTEANEIFFSCHQKGGVTLLHGLLQEISIVFCIRMMVREPSFASDNHATRDDISNESCVIRNPTEDKNTSAGNSFCAG